MTMLSAILLALLGLSVGVWIGAIGVFVALKRIERAANGMKQDVAAERLVRLQESMQQLDALTQQIKDKTPK